MNTAASPHDPHPIGPRHEAVVDGARVTFSWAPAADAEAYALEVAEDPEFHHVLLAREVPADMTTFTVDEPLPTDDRTLFWRVSAGNGKGWSEGERIESFISGTADQAGRFVDPDAREPFGPVAALLSSYRGRRGG
jgi:hypothetical protein